MQLEWSRSWSPSSGMRRVLKNQNQKILASSGNFLSGDFCASVHNNQNNLRHTIFLVRIRADRVIRRSAGSVQGSHNIFIELSSKKTDYHSIKLLIFDWWNHLFDLSRKRGEWSKLLCSRWCYLQFCTLQKAYALYECILNSGFFVLVSCRLSEAKIKSSRLYIGLLAAS